MDDRTFHPSARTGDARNRRRRGSTMRRATAGIVRSPPPTSAPTEPNSGPPLAMAQRRVVGATPPQSHLHQHRLQRQRDSPSFGTVQETIDDLENNRYAVQSNATALSQTLSTPAVLDELEGILEGSTHFGRRTKRRKLDSDPLDTIPKINYGYHGQVEPGRLNMMISYCDGGLLEGDRQYHQDNILQNDKTVYCSGEPKVNLVLSHWGEVPFTCTKIVIKTPVNFPAPVREGMVFVFMERNNMLEATSRFQLKNASSCSLGRSTSTDPSRHRTRLLSRDNPGAWPMEPPDNQRHPLPLVHEMPAVFDFDAFLAEPVHLSRPETSSSLDDPPMIQVPRFPFLSVTSSYDKYITTSCDPPSDDEDEATNQSAHGSTQRAVPSRQVESDEDEDELFINPNNPQRRRYQLRPIEWAGKDQTLSADEPKPPGKDIPYKRFYIHRKKHAISIKFNPPVSSRYILFKLWSPPDRETVDVQSIGVYGYAGPRFFPVLATR